MARMGWGRIARFRVGMGWMGMVVLGVGGRPGFW